MIVLKKFAIDSGYYDIKKLENILFKDDKII